MATSSTRQEDAVQFSRQVWKMQPVSVLDLDDECNIVLACIYQESDSADSVNFDEISMAMQGRIIREDCLLLLSTVRYGYLIVKVIKIESHSLDYLDPEGRAASAYRITGRGTCHCHVDPPPCINETKNPTAVERNLQFDTTTPGYEHLSRAIVDIFRASSQSEAAVSGILLVGCSGVGKTRMAQSVAQQLLQSRNGDTNNNTKDNNTVYHLSVQDLIFQASTEMKLLENVLVPQLRHCSVWILDDLALLETDEADGDEGLPRDVEYMMVRNAILEAIDRFHRQCRIVGIAQNETNLPNELAKIGRLEKTVPMMPPTQTQRMKQWQHILAPNEDVEADSTHHEWAVSLAQLTPGCVARDLIRAYQDAKAQCVMRGSESHGLEWEDLLETVKKIIPSQLEELDIIKPQNFDPTLSDKQVHFKSFKTLGGYSVMKKHLYIHTVSPWKHFLRSMDGGQKIKSKMSWLEPPPGVLFHGKSGTGKTAAAICLATSLQLPLIQVRAADVLDKWLGGSEALLRSLFAKARTASPCILFLDEIDSLAGNREEDDTNDFSSRILSTLLNEMDGVSTSMQSNQVLVIACTNRIGSLDAALLRPGRLQEHILINLPRIDDLVEILELCLEGIQVDQKVSLQDMATRLFEAGATGADTEGLCREACMIAMRTANTAEDVVLAQSSFDVAINERFSGSISGSTSSHDIIV
ncbi:MAG: hypothetical protein SGILL_005838 [Bacillariaceae sp.]